MTLTREQIFASRMDRKPTKLEVDEWGGEIYLKALTVKDQMLLAENGSPEDMPVRVLLACVVDESGEPIFLPGDAEELAKEAFPIVLKIFGEASRLNGLSTKELDEAMANFGNARSGSTSSDLPSLSGDPSQNSEMSAQGS